MSTPIQKKLDQIAQLVNELDAELKKKYGREAHVFFESEGTIHAMRAGMQHHDEGCEKRQSRIIASSNYCRYDCGAW